MGMLNLHAQVSAKDDSADFSLLVSATDEDGQNTATIASIHVDDPNLGQRLRDIAQAYRMATRYGRER